MKPIFDGSVRVVRERDTLLAENEALRKALEPFGEAAKEWADKPDELPVYCLPHFSDELDDTSPTVGDLRQARALTEKRSALEGEE
jgi:hypothetical protein